MAQPRVARCLNCDTEREIRAQPRTVLRCRNCAEHYLAPPLSGTETPAPDPDAPLPVATDEEMAAAGMLGPKVVRLDALDLPAVEVHPPAGEDLHPPVPAPEPAPVPDPDPAPAPAPAPAKPAASPDPEPAPAAEPTRHRRRSYGRGW